MWPTLLNLTRDECRLTLRRLELEAYSNMVNVFRAQGALEDGRKKLLEELRAVLHIGHDRHSAEARRVSNDQLLATIAEQLSGPNTGLGWVMEGRRKIPLMPRGVPQTAYTEIADKAAEFAAAENKQLQKRLEEKMVAPKSTVREIGEAEGQTAEALRSAEAMGEIVCPPVAMEDQTLKLWDTELITRKRKVPEGGAVPDDVTTAVKSMRNLPVSTPQKHLDLTKIYSRFSQPVTSKGQSHSKHSYNQVSKVSTSKSNQPHAPRSTPHKPRAPRTPKQTKPRVSKRKSQEVPMSPSKQFPAIQADLAGPPATFQASYAQSVLGTKPKTEYDDMKSKVLPSMLAESATMQLLTQPATVPHELEVPETHPDDVTALQAQSTPSKRVPPRHYVIKGRGDLGVDRTPTELKSQQKTPEGIKVLSNRPVVLASSSAQKVLGATPKVTSAPAKLVTKVIGSVPKPRPTGAAVKTDASPANKSVADRAPATPRLVVTSAAASTVAKLTESLTPKGIPATDLKVSTKALVLNPKGQKMVVVSGKQERKIPLIHFKGLPSAMKLVPVSQAPRPAAGPAPSKPAESIKTANLADIVPAKGPAPAAKMTNPIVRPSSAKGNVIVVQKGSLGKALTFAKNGNDMSKIIMGKNVTKLLRASKEGGAGAEPPGNVIVLELNDEQSGRPTTMSEILRSQGDRETTPAATQESEARREEESQGRSEMRGEGAEARTEGGSQGEGEARGAGEDPASVTDWEMELDTARKDDDKLDSDSDEYSTARRRTPAPGEGVSLATRTLLSQLQDDVSSDESLALAQRTNDDLTEAKEKLSEKVAEARSQRRRIDVYSTAIPPADITLDSFYLDEGMMDDHMRRLLADDCAPESPADALAK